MLKLLDRLFCRHEDIKERVPVEGKPGVMVLRVVCIHCGRTSHGIEIGGKFGSEAGARQITQARA